MNSALHRVTDRPFRIRAMALLALLPFAFIGGCISGASDVDAPVPRALPLDVKKFHDASAEVTCWQATGSGGISCLPDQWLASARAGGE